ncbi:MAG TPA: hypothetical protein VHZ03_23540 [Trebonia sp.]|nr:hypothetical protein [Trebonia sp.]
MTVLLKLNVRPHYAQVALVDAAWQDYPQWETGDEQVVFGAESLTDPGNPPYPGFAVATQPEIGPDGLCTVRVEVWSDGEPAGLRCVHQSVLRVGSHGVLVGNDQSGSMTELALARGEYRLRVFVDAEATRDVSRGRLRPQRAGHHQARRDRRRVASKTSGRGRCPQFLGHVSRINWQRSVAHQSADHTAVFVLSGSA